MSTEAVEPDVVTGRLARFGARLAHVIRGGKPPPEKRWSLTYVLNLTSAIAIVGITFFIWFGGGYRLAFMDQPIACIPGHVFFLSLGDIDANQVRRGDLYAFKSIGLEPNLRDGALIVKIAAGLPGDRIDVDAEGISINGQWWGPLTPIVLTNSKRTVESVTRSFVVGADEVLMLGTLPRSYDGRYWGAVKETRLIGKARRLI